MAFKKPRNQPQFADLMGILAQTRETENPLYQVVQQLIERLGQMKDVTQERIEEVRNVVSEAITNITIIPPPPGPTVAIYYDTPLTDGSLDETDLIFAMGECITVQVPNVP